MSIILAVDQSTSATKSILFDTKGRVLDRASLDHRQICSRPGWVEHDAEEIWANTLATIRDLLSRNPETADEIIALSITNQRETILVFERGTGRPLHNAIVWQDRRGEAICQEFQRSAHSGQIRSKTGLPIDTYFSGSKLKWLLREYPEIASQVRSGNALVGTIDVYLVYRLTGGNVFATDHTNASRTLLYNINSLGWDAELCSLFEVPESALPDVRESFARFGDTDAEGYLGRRVPICGVMGDSQGSLFAQRCYQPGMAKATFGTGTSVLLNIGQTWTTTESGSVSALAWVLHGQPTYALEGLINYSAATLAWLKNQLGLISNVSESEALARAVRDTGGVYLIPAFAGMSAPYSSSGARAAIIGMSTSTTREHVVRAALEAIAYQLRDVLEMMRSDSGIVPRKLLADGGPTRNGFLMQFAADMCDLEIEAAEVPESSAWGAALAGLLGLEVYDTCEELEKLPRETRRYLPSPDRKAFDSLHKGWKEALHRVLAEGVGFEPTERFTVRSISSRVP